MPLDSPVPTCPGWDLAALLRHQGFVHRWATRYVTEGLEESVDEPPEAEILSGGTPDDALAAWFDDGWETLAAALEKAPATLRCWTFLPAPDARTFWARRQAHETTIHAADGHAAVIARGVSRPPLPIAAPFAVDGIDELLLFFARDRDPVEGPRLLVEAADTGDRWDIVVGKESVLSRRGWAGPGSCVVVAPAADIYLALWNRSPLDPLVAEGDASVARAWAGAATLTWS